MSYILTNKMKIRAFDYVVGQVNMFDEKINAIWERSEFEFNDEEKKRIDADETERSLIQIKQLYGDILLEFFLALKANLNIISLRCPSFNPFEAVRYSKVYDEVDKGRINMFTNEFVDFVSESYREYSSIDEA